MNIFLPYEEDIERSVRSLDDKRLNKSILECKQLLINALKEEMGYCITGYKNHPIYLHYKSNPYFLATYGYKCCVEYQYRFHKSHSLTHQFMTYISIEEIDIERVSYTPFYMEGSKNSPNSIRTTENVSERYQKKLIDKWDTDKAKGRPPKWTNREIPIFYKEK